MIARYRCLAIIAGLAMIAALTGCMDRDPYRRTDVWRPTGANAANIAAQVADPNDLIRGRGASSRAGASPSTLAVDRVQTDNPKTLRGFGSATDSSGSGGSGAGAGPSGGSGAGGVSPGS